MDGDLRTLIDDPRFREYHRAHLQREFNTFDVLRYADYEIRHSNVLAWLLRPADTHGIGERFLEWFVNHVNERRAAENVEPLPVTDLGATNVSVWRERDYVDITVMFKAERWLIAIENKVGPASSDHVEQVSGYERKLRGQYEGHSVASVLLTTSPDGSVDFPGIVHVGWDAVHTAIRSFLDDGEFHSSSVGAFVRQYLDLVERWFRPAGGEVFTALLNDHRSILKEMRRVLEKDGEDGVRGMVPEDRPEYGDSLARLVKESRQSPKELRRTVAEHLKARGRGTLHFTQNPRSGVYWLNWSNAGLADVARRLGCGDFSLSWGMTFAHHRVDAGFWLYQTEPEEQDPLDRLKRFMQATPINRHKPDQYPMRDSGYGWYRVYDQEILSKDELSDMSRHEVKDKVIRWLVAFMDSSDSEYRRIDDYFRCLAFRSDDSASTGESSAFGS